MMIIEDFTDVILVTEDKKQPSTSDQSSKLIKKYSHRTEKVLKVVGVVVVHEIFWILHKSNLQIKLWVPTFRGWSFSV